MRVVGFAGSPRVGGNTETLVRRVLDGARAEGAETEMFRLNDHVIAPCQACDRCQESGICATPDDMTWLSAKLLAADVIVLGTPIYYWAASAQLKTFLDRWYALEQHLNRALLEGKRCLLVCCFADADPKTADSAITLVHTMCDWFHLKWIEPILASAGKAGEVSQDRTTMDKAYVIGQELANL